MRQIAFTDKQALGQLRQLGLSPTACFCYLLLVQQLPRSLPSAYIKELLPIPDASLYRALNELMCKGFAEKWRIVSAHRYRAVPLSYALDNYALYLREQVQSLLQRLHDTG